ncbi:MAG: sulfotransferase [Desulfohalobiaceae bacterium]
MDQLLCSPDPEQVRNGRHIFVSGLARSGTTALLRFLHSTGRFCSLSYRDLPFPLAPFLWRRCLLRFSAQQDQPRHRVHQDGLLMDLDGPEALEEVFWRIFCGDLYICGDRLIPMQAEEEDIELFRKYIAGLLKTSGNADRYLSKNNNNILRLSSILEAFPVAKIIIPFRDPMQQAQSLLAQHLHFLELHRTNKFFRKYMSWLGHYEFGKGHRFFDVYPGTMEYSADSACYWLQEWIRVYSYLLEQVQNVEDSVLFLEYERLCADQGRVWKALASKAFLPDSPPTGFCLKQAPVKEVVFTDSLLQKEAYRVHSQLQAECRKALKKHSKK